MPSQTEIRTKITQPDHRGPGEGRSAARGECPGRRTPTDGACPTNAATGRRYSGINPLILQCAARRHGFRSKFWATFNQWKDLGCCVKARPSDVAPGAWGTTAILYKPITKTEIDKKTGEEKEKAFPLLRTFTLFNADQVTGAEALAGQGRAGQRRLHRLRAGRGRHQGDGGRHPPRRGPGLLPPPERGRRRRLHHAAPQVLVRDGEGVLRHGPARVGPLERSTARLDRLVRSWRVAE